MVVEVDAVVGHDVVRVAADEEERVVRRSSTSSEHACTVAPGMVDAPYPDRVALHLLPLSEDEADVHDGVDGGSRPSVSMSRGFT